MLCLGNVVQWYSASFARTKAFYLSLHSFLESPVLGGKQERRDYAVIGDYHF